jgi:tyrosine-protein phosphatase SIW14
VRFSAIHARVFTAALLFSVSATIPVVGQTRSVDVPSKATDISTIRIDNFGRIDPTYYRGGQPRGGDYKDLASLGVKTVINLTSDDSDAREKAMVEGVGMHYVQIAMTTHEPPTAAQLAEFLKVVTEPANQPVFVHCVGGRHRTGVMTAAYRMSHDGWSSDRAFAEMKQYKFGADFLHAEFKEFVYGYQATSAARPATATATAAR